MTIVEQADQVMGIVDYPMVAMVHQYLRSRKINLLLKEKITVFDPDGEAVVVKTESQKSIPADNIIIGNKRVCKGTIGTSIAKVFDMTVASAGVSERLLSREGIAYNTSLCFMREKANALIGTFGFCRPTSQTQKTKRAYFFANARQKKTKFDL